MAVDLKTYSARKVRSVTADLGDGDVITLSYDPSKYTEDFVSRLKDLSSDEEGNVVVSLAVANLAIRELVTKWDLLESPKGKAVPLTEAAIRHLPIEMTGPVVAAIFEDQNPGND